MQTISSLLLALCVCNSVVARPAELSLDNVLTFNSAEVEASGSGPVCDANRHQCLLRSRTQYFISADHDGMLHTSQDIHQKDYLQFSSVGLYYIKIQSCHSGNFFAVVDGALTTVQDCGDHVESNYCHWFQSHTHKGTVYRNLATEKYLTITSDGRPTLSKEADRYKPRATFTLFDCSIKL
ncbi:uncharacterized protein [Antedon mediterranea]|uniref:uncharacterized protein n=1 Tax=Antedon mediterranea TaxID=105859 RepID=UPI003AF488F3